MTCRQLKGRSVLVGKPALLASVQWLCGAGGLHARRTLLHDRHHRPLVMLVLLSGCPIPCLIKIKYFIVISDLYINVEEKDGNNSK